VKGWFTGPPSGHAFKFLAYHRGIRRRPPLGQPHRAWRLALTCRP